MAYELTDIVKQGGANAPGMSEQIKMCLKKDILAFPPTTTPVVNPEDAITLDGNITFDTDFGFVNVYATKDTVRLMLKKVGQKDSRGINAELEFFVPALHKKFAALLREDPDVVFLVKKPDCAGSEWIVLGSACRGLEINGDFDSDLANNESGRHGYTAKGQGYIPEFYFYSGTVTMKP